MATFATYALLALGLGVTWFSLANAGGAAANRSFDGCLFGLGLALWTAVPFGGLAWAARRWRESRRSRTILLVAAGLLAAATIELRRAGALTDLTFLFLPAWEAIAVVVFAVAAASQTRDGAS